MAMHTGCFGDMDIASSTNHTLLCQFDEKPSIISGCTECCVPCATAVFQLLLLLLRSSSSPTCSGFLQCVAIRPSVVCMACLLLFM